MPLKRATDTHLAWDTSVSTRLLEQVLAHLGLAIWAIEILPGISKKLFCADDGGWITS